MSVKNASTRSDQDSGNSGSLSGQSTVVGVWIRSSGVGATSAIDRATVPEPGAVPRNGRGEGARRRVDLDEVLEVGVRKGERLARPVVSRNAPGTRDRGGVTVDQLLDEAQLMKPLVPILHGGPPGSRTRYAVDAGSLCLSDRPNPRRSGTIALASVGSIARRGGNPNDHPASRAATPPASCPASRRRRARSRRRCVSGAFLLRLHRPHERPLVADDAARLVTETCPLRRSRLDAEQWCGYCSSLGATGTRNRAGPVARASTAGIPVMDAAVLVDQADPGAGERLEGIDLRGIDRVVRQRR